MKFHNRLHVTNFCAQGDFRMMMWSIMFEHASVCLDNFMIERLLYFYNDENVLRHFVSVIRFV